MIMLCSLILWVRNSDKAQQECVSLLHDVCGLMMSVVSTWSDSDSWARNYLEASSLICLAAGLCSAGTALPTCGCFMWLELLTTWVSRGYKLGVSIPKEPGRAAWLFMTAWKDNRDWPIKKKTNCSVWRPSTYGWWSVGQESKECG